MSDTLEADAAPSDTSAPAPDTGTCEPADTQQTADPAPQCDAPADDAGADATPAADTCTPDQPDGPQASTPDTGGTCEPDQQQDADTSADPSTANGDDPAQCSPHDDWTRRVFGFDPAAPVVAAPPPDSNAAEPADAGVPDDDRPDADGDGPSGAPPGADQPPPADTDPDAGSPDASAPADAPAAAADPAQSAKDSADKIKNMNPDDLQKLGPDERLKLMQDLQSPPQSDDAKAAQKKLYENTPMDPKAQAVDDARNEKLVQDLQNDKELQDARRNWPNMTPDERAAAVKKVVAAQSKAMGMDPPEVVLDKGTTEGGLTVSGVYNKDDGKLHLNSDSGSDLNNSLDKAVAIATHENTHKYQYQLISKLDSGQLKPGDPEYDQARLLKANDVPGGYVDPSTANEKAYRNQPFEQQAYHTGDKMGKGLNKGLYNTSGDWAFDGRPGPIP